MFQPEPRKGYLSLSIGAFQTRHMALKTFSFSGHPAVDGEPVDLCYLDSEKQPQGYFKSQNDAFLQVI